MRICFVCLGNICRSPTAEGVMRRLVARAHLADRVTLDSAGTGAYHVGEQPDSRSCAAARRRNLDLTTHRAWQFTERDFARFDLVVAMDGANLRNLRAMAARANSDVEIVLLRSFDTTAGRDAEVPDPWYGGVDGFEEVLDQCERACEGLLEHVRSHYSRYTNTHGRRAERIRK